MRTSSILNPSFVSLNELLRMKRTTEQSPMTIDESLVDISVNAESDISSLVDRSRGTMGTFNSARVSCVLLIRMNINKKLRIDCNSST